MTEIHPSYQKVNDWYGKSIDLVKDELARHVDHFDPVHLSYPNCMVIITQAMAELNQAILYQFETTDVNKEHANELAIKLAAVALVMTAKIPGE